MPRRKTVNLDFKDILDSLDDRDFDAELLRKFTDRFGDNRELRDMLVRDIKKIKRAGYFKYYHLIYRLLKAAREHNMYVDVAGDGLGHAGGGGGVDLLSLVGFHADVAAGDDVVDEGLSVSVSFLVKTYGFSSRSSALISVRL